MATCQTPHQIYMLLNMMTRRLDDNNFIIWRYQFQTVLEGQDLFGYIDGSTLSPTKYVITDDEGVTDEVSTAYKEWKKTDKAILSLLLATLSFDTMDYVVGSKTSREAWIRLNDRYNTFSRSHVMQLKTEMYTITKGMDSVEIYLQKVTRARNKLDALGVRMEDEDIVVVVLNGLPAEFNLIKAIIRGRKSPIAMQELRILLLSAERDIANRVVLNIQAFSAMKTKKIVSQRCLNGNGNRSKTGGDARRNRNNFLSSSQCQICREKDTAVRCFYRNIALPDQSSNSVLICQICDMKGHAALECNHLGTHIGVSPAVVDGGEQTVVIDEREHNMINDDGSDNSGRAVATDEREHNMINGDGSDKSGRENIGGVFVAEDISRTGSDECDSSGRDNIGGVSVAEDCSSTGSSIGIQYVDQVSVDQVPPDIASFEAVIRNSVCSVVGELKVEVHAINHNQVIMISAAFLIILCSVHNFGTSKLGIAIDPAFFIWFCPLGGIGIYNIIQNDSSVLRAFNHVHIYSFFKRNSTKALHSLESCLLCATGSEAMYTDYFAVQFVQLTFVCLVLSSLMWEYLGHTAYLMENPSGADQHLFPSISSGIYAKNFVDITVMGVSSSCAALCLSHVQVLKNEGTILCDQIMNRCIAGGLQYLTFSSIACGIKRISATEFCSIQSFIISLVRKVLSSILPISVC